MPLNEGGLVPGFGGVGTQGSQGSQGNQGTQGTQGAQGAQGVSLPSQTGQAGKVLSTNGTSALWEALTTGSGELSFNYTFSTSTSAADPGAGLFAFNNATPASVTHMYVDYLDYAGTNVGTWLNYGIVFNHLYIYNSSDPTKFIEVLVTARTKHTGPPDWYDFTVTVLSSGTLPGTTAGDLVVSNGNVQGAGYYALASNTTGFDNTAIGHFALTNNTTGAANTAIGMEALAANTTGGIPGGAGNLGADEASNTAIGTSALRSNTTASLNTAIGGAALEDNTTGTQNVAIGNMALEVNTTGNYNIAIGKSALNYFVAVDGNIAIGQQALQGTVSNFALNTGNYNVAVGHQALTACQSGIGGVAIGEFAGTALVSGSGNIFIGAHTGAPTWNGTFSTITGAYNTMIGQQAGPGSAADPSYTVCIGREASVIGNYSMALGTLASTGAAGAVAIGTDHTGAGAASATQDLIVLGTANHTTQIPGTPAFVAGDHYLVVDSSGNIHKSALGPAS